MPSTMPNPSVEARLDALELLLREILAFTLARSGIVERARMTVDASEREAVLRGDEQSRHHTAAVRVAVDRLVE